ncbi:hypothetical protein D1817_12350 [Flavobacteriaceae bacterium]|nr:hypothetical protein D1817_12350 [Flavobacteriaceae bacterium]
MFEQYNSALKKGDEDKWSYTSDTIKVWFDNKKGKPSLRIKGKKSTGKWKEWDEEMHSSSYYDTIWYDQRENSIKGYFYENNDFYELIGKAPTKTLRTYWLNQNNKINEILMYWIPEENTTTDQHLKPIVEWAILNDSSEIKQLYPNNRIVPSKENAKRWKNLLNKYKMYTNNGHK